MARRLPVRRGKLTNGGSRLGRTKHADALDNRARILNAQQFYGASSYASFTLAIEPQTRSGCERSAVSRAFDDENERIRFAVEIRTPV